MGDLSDFQRGQIVDARLVGASVTKTYFIRCIQSSSLRGYAGKHKSWEDIISYEE